MTPNAFTPWATGSCMCGKVKYVVVEKPASLNQYICHCVLCKKASGSAYMTNWWMSEDVFTISGGADFLKQVVITKTLNKSHVTRSFCGECGSPIYIKSTNPNASGQVGVTAGTLDFDKKLSPEQNLALTYAPDAELFIEDRLVCLNPIEGVEQCNYREKSLAQQSS